MTVLSDKWISKMSKEKSMISPFEEKQVRGNYTKKKGFSKIRWTNKKYSLIYH